jgi:putative transposase
MRKTRFSESQIVKILKEVEAGRTAKEACREYGISSATYYKWKSKYGGMESSDIKRLKELEEENRRLKQMYADLSFENRALKDVIERKL